MQEIEAYIFLEQALEKLADADLARQVNEALREHHLDTLLAPVWAPHINIEEHSSGWQKRSAKLYRAAAEVAKRLGH